MRKLFITLFVLVITLQYAQSQAPGCPSVNAGNDQTINCSGNVLLQANALHTGLTNTYAVSSIPYAPPYPFNTGNAIFVSQDDIWSGLIALPFNFCYYGNTYNQIVVGANGLVSFNAAYANQSCPWAFSASVPSASLPLNSIFGPYHDIHPGVGGAIYWALLGSYPCRTFVVNYYQVPMFSCTNLNATHQIVLYESTNVIEVYMQNKPLCASWNSGRAVVGIQNSTGTVGLAAPGRNTNQWTATNEAWRFTPDGLPNYTINWFQGPYQISTGASTTVSPTATTTYTAVCTYDNCDGTQITVTDDVTVNVTNPINLVVTPLSDTICAGESTTISATGAATYSWSPTTNLTLLSDSVVTVSPPTSTTYTLVVTDQLGTCTGSVEVYIYVNPPPSIAITALPQNICAGDTTELLAINASTYLWNDGSTANPRNVWPSATTTYTVTGYDAIGCTNTASITVNVSNIPVITFSPPNPSICDGQTAIVTASGAQFYFWSNSTTTNPLSVTPETTTTYTVTGTDNTGMCSSSAEVIVTVNPSPDVSFSGIPLAGCSPLTTAFTDASTHSSQWLWNFGDGSTSTQQNPTHTYNTTGLYDISLTVTSAQGCTSSLTLPAYTEVYPQPVADFYTFPEIGKTYDPKIIFYSDTDAQYWTWDFGDGASSNMPPPVVHTYAAIEAQYQAKLVVFNDYGCIDSIVKTVIIIDDILVFPNVITPNADGYNDYLEIKNADKYPNNLLQVFNRWGKMVYEQQNYDNKWDGGNLADGTYYYVFKYIDQVYNGSLTILRE